jgi:hypothetical protein
MTLGSLFFTSTCLSLGLVSMGISADPATEMPPLQLNTTFTQVEASEPAKLEYQNPYLKHASLAAFSVSSLAIGGVFYAMQHSLKNPNVGFVGGESSSLNSAIGAAGFTALIAGAAYFYYSHLDVKQAKVWNAQVSGDLTPSGGVNVVAIVTVPLALFNP